MAKVVAFEDVTKDAVDKYKPLFITPDFTLLLTEAYLFSDIRSGSLNKQTANYFRSHGLDPSKALYYTLGDKIPEADFYFVDSLDGMWWGVMQFLSREKSFLISSNPRANEEARWRGFQTFPGGITLNDWYKQLGIL